MDKPELHKEIKRQLLEYLINMMDKNEGSRLAPLKKEEEMPEDMPEAIEDLPDSPDMIEVEMIAEGDEAEDLLKRLKKIAKG